jgi:hypothetical protein
MAFCGDRTHSPVSGLQKSPARLPLNRIRILSFSDIYRDESPRALFKGLGPTLVGVIPARSINFFTYGNGKQIIAEQFNHGRENSYVHLTAAALAGIITGTATNPIWVVKTRMQLSASKRLQANLSRSATSGRTVLGGSWGTIKEIMRQEGVRGFYKGLSASYLGVTEGTIQWVLYERLKKLSAGTQGRGGLQEWFGMLGSAGTAKCVASLITYPHEVRLYPLLLHVRKCLLPTSGTTNTSSATESRWEAEVHRSGADAPSCHRRGGRSIIVWRIERTSDACRAQCCRDVFDI